MSEKRFTTVKKDDGLFYVANDKFGVVLVSKEESLMVMSMCNDMIECLNKIYEENEQLKETLNLIADAKSFTKEESVKEILRHEIYGIDTAAGESANAFHEYMVLSTFFKKHYKEHWDND